MYIPKEQLVIMFSDTKRFEMRLYTVNDLKIIYSFIMKNNLKKKSNSDADDKEFLKNSTVYSADEKTVYELLTENPLSILRTFYYHVSKNIECYVSQFLYNNGVSAYLNEDMYGDYDVCINNQLIDIKCGYKPYSQSPIYGKDNKNILYIQYKELLYSHLDDFKGALNYYLLDTFKNNYQPKELYIFNYEIKRH